MEAGLSLAGLAAGRVTRAAIHLVETGRSRPSMPVLEMIAERTGKPVAWFLEPAARGQARDLDREARIAELEALCESERYEEALAHADALRQVLRTEDEEARVLHFLGRALLLTDRAEDAVEPLRRALALFEALDDEFMAVETLDWLSSAMFELDDASARSLQEDAIRRCRALDPVPLRTEFRILTNLARMQVARHEWRLAVQVYEEALERGREIQDARRMAAVHLGVASAYRNLGDLGRAVTYTQRGAALQALQLDRALVSAAEEQLGRLLMRQEDLEGAEQHLRQAVDSAQQLGLGRRLRQAELALAGLHLRRGDPDAARQIAGPALEGARREGEPEIEAEAHSVLARAEALSGDAEAADRHFQAAIATLQGTALLEALVEAHRDYALALKERGETAAALDQLEKAMALSRPQARPSAREVDQGRPARR